MHEFFFLSVSHDVNDMRTSTIFKFVSDTFGLINIPKVIAWQLAEQAESKLIFSYRLSL